MENKYDLSSLATSQATLVYNILVSVLQAERAGMKVEEMLVPYEEELTRRGLGDRVKKTREVFHLDEVV